MTRASLISTGLALLFVLLQGCNVEARDDGDKDDKKSSKRKRKALLVRTTKPDRRSMERRLPMTGKMTPLLEAEVVAQVTGVPVLELLKDVGDEVKKNEVIARLDTTELAHKLAEAENAVLEAQEKIDESRFTVTDLMAEKLAHVATVTRKKQVWERLRAQTKGVSLDEVEAAKYEYDAERARQKRYEVQIQRANAAQKVAQRARKAAELARDKARRDLGHAEVLAPIDGVVTERLARIGQLSATGQPIYRIYDPKKLVARTKLAQHHLRNVRTHQVVRFRGDAYPDVTFIAEVALIEPQVDQDNAMVAVRLRLDAEKTLSDPENRAALARTEYRDLKALLLSGRTLQPGMFVSGQIVLETRTDVLTVPRKAIAYLRGQPYVYVVEPRAVAGIGDDVTPAETDAEDIDAPDARWRVRRLYFREGLADDGRVEFVPLSKDKTLPDDADIVLVGQDRLKDGDPVRVEGDVAGPDAGAVPAGPEHEAEGNGASNHGSGKD